MCVCVYVRVCVCVRACDVLLIVLPMTLLVHTAPEATAEDIGNAQPMLLESAQWACGMLRSAVQRLVGSEYCVCVVCTCVYGAASCWK